MLDNIFDGTWNAGFLAGGGRNLVKNGDFSKGATWMDDSVLIGPYILKDSDLGCNFRRVSISDRIYTMVSNVWDEGQLYTVSYWARKAPSIISLDKYITTKTKAESISVNSVTENSIELRCDQPAEFRFLQIDLTKLLVPGVTYELHYNATGQKTGMSIDEATDSGYGNRTKLSVTNVTAVSGRYYRLKIYANVGEKPTTETYNNVYTNVTLRPVSDELRITPSRSLQDYGEKATLSYEWERYTTKIRSTKTVPEGTLSFLVSNKAVVFDVTKIKLERGDTATAWTPAPEDYPNSIYTNTISVKKNTQYAYGLADAGTLPAHTVRYLKSDGTYIRSENIAENQTSGVRTVTFDRDYDIEIMFPDGLSDNEKIISIIGGLA